MKTAGMIRYRLMFPLCKLMAKRGRFLSNKAAPSSACGGAELMSRPEKELRMANSGASIAQKKWIQILHVAKRDCGLDDEAYRAVLFRAAGVESARDIKTWKQYENALQAFYNIGFRMNSKTSIASGLKETDTATKRNPAWITVRQEYYIRGLWDLASRKKDEASLRAIIKRIGGVEDLRFLMRVDAQKVILALRDITGRAGYNPDEPPGKED